MIVFSINKYSKALLKVSLLFVLSTSEMLLTKLSIFNVPTDYPLVVQLIINCINCVKANAIDTYPLSTSLKTLVNQQFITLSTRIQDKRASIAGIILKAF